MTHQATAAEPAPFRIHIDQRQLDDLSTRLGKTRWSRPIADDWGSGTQSSYLRDLIAYWQDGYDWRRHEARLNQLDQFKARVGDANLHFVHVRGPGLEHGYRPLPLLLLHGWPDSFYRYHKVVSMFSDPSGQHGTREDACDVVVPSLPGFAFTGRVPLPETEPTRHSAELLWRLMTQVLGYERFVIAGGDGGSVLAQLIAIDHPESVLGIHLTDLGWHALDVDPSSLSKSEGKYLEASKKHMMTDGAYALVQMTQPRSLAAGLNDSPVGLASWIVDRFHSWSDLDPERESGISRDDLLTNIMLYWLTQSIGSSVFNYYADARSPSLSSADHVDRPVGVALFPDDIGGVPPRSLAERTLNVQRWTELRRGGHFAALEEPELFASDVIDFCRSLRGGQQVRKEASHVTRAV